jgi:hypothetical protein
MIPTTRMPSAAIVAIEVRPVSFASSRLRGESPADETWRPFDMGATSGSVAPLPVLAADGGGMTELDTTASFRWICA